MRNLKRALSLAMASIMLLGMMVMGASAATSYDDFSDKDKIVNTEAVNTMVSLGVLAGRDTGDFDPTGVVTRAEMAKIIAFARNGGKDPILGTATANFTDTKGHWAESYIAYCANQGMLNGYGDGTFKPNATVTGTEAAKMVLTALGYRSDIEKLTGANWALNTDSLANKVHLYDGLAINPNEGLTRDNTAQMIYNGVQADEVQYENNYGEYSGVIYAKPNGTMLANRFGVIKVTGVLEANEYMAIAGSPTKEGYLRFVSGTVKVPNYSSAQITAMGVTFKTPASNNMIGQEVVIYVKFLNNLAPNAVNSTVLGTTIATTNNTVYETYAKLADGQKVKDALRDSAMVVDGGTATHFYGYLPAGKGPFNNGIVDTAGLKQRFIDNDNDGAVDYIIQELPALAKVSTYNESSKTLTLSGGIGSFNFSDVYLNEGETIAKDDYVLVISYDGNKMHIEKAEKAEGAITAFNNANKKISVDGTSYGYGLGDNKTAGSLVNPTLINTVGDTYVIYLDKGKNVLGCQLVDSTISNLAVVSACGISSNELGSYTGKVKLVQADGTTGTYTVDLSASAKRLGAVSGALTSDNNKTLWTAWALNTGVVDANTAANIGQNPVAAPNGNGIKGEIVSYSVNEKTGVVTLGLPGRINADYSNVYRITNNTGLSPKSSTTSYSFNKDIAFANSTTNMVADNNTVFFIYNTDGSYSVVVGVNKLSSSAMTNIAFPAGATYTANNTNFSGGTTFGTGVSYKAPGTSTNVAKAILVNGNTASYASNATYLYISDSYTKTGADTYQYPVVFEDGTAGTIKTKDNIYPYDAVYAYQTDTDGYTKLTDDVSDTRIVNGKVVTYRNGSTFSYADGVQLASGTGSKSLAGKVSIWNVEATDKIYAQDALSQDMSVRFVTDNDGFVKLAFVVDSNAVYRDVTNKTGTSITVNGVVLADNNAPGTLQVASGYDVVVSTASHSVSYTYTVGSDTYTKVTSTTSNTFGMPANTNGVTINSGNGIVVYTANIALQWQASGVAGGAQGASAPGAVTVGPINNAVNSVVITLTNSAAQTVTKGGADASDVTLSAAGANMTATVNTTSVAAAGGTKTFTLTVSEAGKTSITYTVTVTVNGTTLKVPTAITLVATGGTAAVSNSGDLLDHTANAVAVSSAAATNTITITNTTPAGATFSYAIDGAGTDTTDAAYSIVAGDIGNDITVTVTVTEAGFASWTATYTIAVS